MDEIHDPNRSELVASARAVIRDVPASVEQTRTLNALVDYAEHLERELAATKDFVERALTTLRAGLS